MAISAAQIKKLNKGRTHEDFVKKVEKVTGKKFKDIPYIKNTVKELKLGI